MFFLNASDPLGLRWEHIDALDANSPASNAQLGQAVAISGDTIVVGEPRRDDVGGPGTASGAAYTYVRSGMAWSGPTKHLTTAQNEEQLGGSVAIDGDLMVAGAIGTMSGGNSVGSAYVFSRTTTWGSTPVAQVFAQNPAQADSFGASVAIDETEELLIVGADFDELPAPNGVTNSGVVHIFTGNGPTTWTPSQELSAGSLNAQINGQFGCSVSLDYPRLVVGACQHDTPGLSGTNHGAAYVFVTDGTTWTLEDELLAFDDNGTSAGTDGEKFGRCVSIEGDTVVVGSLTGEAAYMFDRSGATWSPRTPILISGNTSTSGTPSHAAGFGRAVSQSGSRLAIGAELDDTAAGVDSGSAYVFAPFSLNHAFYGTPEPTGFNAACPVSTLSFTGAASMTSNSPFIIFANDVPDNLNGSGNGCGVGGTFFWGINGRDSMVLGEGTMLVKSWHRIVIAWEITGTPPCSTSCGNSIGIDFNSTIQSGNYPVELFVGQQVNAQWLASHSAEASANPSGTDLREATNAIEFVVCP